jgi:hypothetical protein
MAVNDPIIIDPNSIPGQLWALFRYILTAGGAYAIGKGWIDGELLTLLTGFATIAVPTMFGVWKVYHAKKESVALAEMAPNSKAMVKK